MTTVVATPACAGEVIFTGFSPVELDAGPDAGPDAETLDDGVKQEREQQGLE